MPSLDIAINGERYCVAGADDLPMFSAFPQIDPDKTYLYVYVFGGTPRPLRIGDVVTIRIVEAGLDIPVRSATGFGSDVRKIVRDSDRGA